MALEHYRSKRDFKKTPEPRGAKQPADTRGMFVIQKHAASRLHYDFRLELDGVLLSWAVPKGPSLDPGEKRLAVHVEDHPVEYGDFEGIIPKGQYGGGTVLLWDRGRWFPEGDPHAAYRKGHLKFRLEGTKLQGGWALVQMHGERSENGKNWLLIKEKDATAQPGSDGRVTTERPESVATRRTIEDVASEPDRVWHSSAAKPERSKRRTAARSERTLRGKSALPATVEPELATLVDEPPAGDGWLHEIKYDGYRILCRIDEGEVTLVSRNGKDWTAPFAVVASAARAVPARRALLDGEVVMLEPNGTTSFQALQNALKGGRADELSYVVFDLLHLDGVDLRGLPLEERKRELEALLAPLARTAGGTIRVSEHVLGNGPAFLEEACRFRLEGIVSKRRESPYQAGRGRDWLKVKCALGQEFVIGGFTEPAGSRSGFGALLIGYYDAQQKLHYAGKVGTGFSERTLADLHRRLVKLERKEPPFVDPPHGYAARGNHYVKPELVAEVRFTEWTNDGQLRHPAFLGLREDKDAALVTREETLESRPMSTPRRAAPAAATKREPRSPQDGGVVAGVKLTHPDRVMYAEEGITKLELARFYEGLAPYIMPHVTGRPLSIVRCPEGHEKTCFFQKHANETTARAVGHVMIEEGGKERPYLMIDTVAGLVSLIQMGALELHVWGAPGDDVEHPDRVVFDLDPGPGVDWSGVIEGTLKVKETLESIGLRSFLKTSGGKGLHVVVPFKGKRPDWDTTKAFARAVAERIARAEPSRYIVNMSKAKRQGRIFIDYLRNGRGATTICAWSTRARDGAPVSVPVHWDELNERLRPDTWNVRNLPERLATLTTDPWRELGTVRQTLTASARKTLGI